jgi:catechol 2,3-dioxygenase-like lactoylglutathione lyase family enzyme
VNDTRRDPSRREPAAQERTPRNPSSGRADVGATHLALVASDLARSVPFYQRYAGMQVVHERSDPGGARVVWLSDLTRPFVLVLIEGRVEARLAGFSHLGVGCASRAEVDRLAAAARAEGCLELGPTDSGEPVGYWAFLRDPDGHHLELSFGQEVGLTVANARGPDG